MLYLTNQFFGGTPMLFSKCKCKKGYCRYCGEECPNFKLDKQNPHISICKFLKTGMFKDGRVISKTTPSGGAIIKAPDWCPKK